MIRSFIRRGRVLAAVTLLASMLPIAATAAEATQTVDQTGRELSNLFISKDIDALWQRMTPQMREALKSREAFVAFREQVDALGVETAVLSETSKTASGFRIYLRASRWSKALLPIEMQWALDVEGNIAGFYVRPTKASEPAPSAHTGYQTKAQLRLPFEGSWHVVWGGRTLQQNYHAATRDQRYAYDLLKQIDGSTHRGAGQKLSDYYCWNERILAPAPATVVTAMDGLPDQAIGTRDAAHAAGNHVILDLGHGEYALLAHLQQGTVRVKPGEKVATGAELGRCGNSGNTSEPHLHFHVQNATRFGEGDGLPAYFNHFTADDREVARGELVQGQTIKASDGP